MPSINRIRVNNVKYNFGTQFYDDFTMRMYGKNTLYDLANGGGKSVLMLLLLQNMIPNCTLDEKQPVEKLFRTGNGNTTIHSLVEWKLDEPDTADGYRYMTTGFCARKAKEAENDEGQRGDVASIEYFNYCIFYREYNKNDIINLPLVSDGERISYQGLKNYLKELEHRDMSLQVRVFERKGEYQRYISNYGIHESQWEIIRGINKTEGHVRAYFENNYKTTRKVVEDLLIEEIIEKAFLVKTQEDETDGETMAKMLMDIKEQLTLLAKKKKDIAGYDHQIELLSVLADKVESFLGIYEEQTALSGTLADICVTGEEFVKNDEEHMERLAAKREAKRSDRDIQRRRLECLKVARDKGRLAELDEKEKHLGERLSECEKRLEEQSADILMRESVNEYLLYIEDRKKYYQNDAIIKNIMADSEVDEEQLYTYAYNIKMRTDTALGELRKQIAALSEELSVYADEKERREKLLQSARTELAIAENTKSAADEEIVSLSEKLSSVRMSMNSISFTGLDSQLEEGGIAIEELKKRREGAEKAIEESRIKLSEAQLELSRLGAGREENRHTLDTLLAREDEYEEAADKIEKLKTVYHADEGEKLAAILEERITDAVLEVSAIKKNIDKSTKRIKQLEEGRLIEMSGSVKKVVEYIDTRHGIAAIYGMDYLSALPAERRRELLDKNPELPYSVIVSDYDAIKNDPNIAGLDTGSSPVYIFDEKSIDEKSIHLGESVVSVHALPDYLTDEATVAGLIENELLVKKDSEMNLAVREEMLEAYRQDREFVLKIFDSELIHINEKIEELREQDKKLEQRMSQVTEEMKSYKSSISQKQTELKDIQGEYESLVEDMNRLHTASELAGLIAQKEKQSADALEKTERLRETVGELSDNADSGDISLSEKQVRLRTLEQKYQELMREWDEYYSPYYRIDEEYEVLTAGDDDLKARFMALIRMQEGDIKSVEDKKQLLITLKNSMDRTLRNIEKRGTDIKLLERLEAENELVFCDEDVMDKCKKSLGDIRIRRDELIASQKETAGEKNKLLGSIEYAIQNITDAFGSYEEVEASLSEIVTDLENGKELMARLEREVRECDEEYRTYVKQQGYMTELYKDVKRIIATNDISLENARLLSEDKDSLRDVFEESLLAYDKSTKELEKAKNELLKFKGNTAATLDRMENYELAATVRDDVQIPSDFEEAKLLMQNLRAIMDYIGLERDRIEKSLADMETIKNNFEEQCLQRCLDVRTELDKLPKLSRIISDGEVIQVVGLTVPYVKDEFMKQRMSDYIDRLVAEADDYNQDKDRMKFIRGSLALKKLFGVIVTDMNAIKLSLYKRERIKEQSRYLRYEEAVGSTGQSQGIYIQFLVSIINYISGMYQTGDEDTRTKTVFIDNPFGAAKDVYIWEPIFALLEANHVQLIVPARGATPAITGKFDINYILGQQMSGNKQLTVVTDYTSRVDQEELEYKDLEYEQVSFDFI